VLWGLEPVRELGVEIGSELGVGASADEDTCEASLGTEISDSDSSSVGSTGIGGSERLLSVPSEDSSKLDGVMTDSDSKVDAVGGSEDNNSGSEPDTGRLSVGSDIAGKDDGV
jgi:hypothetical protein